MQRQNVTPGLRRTQLEGNDTEGDIHHGVDFAGETLRGVGGKHNHLAMELIVLQTAH